MARAGQAGFLGGPWDGRRTVIQLGPNGAPPPQLRVATPESLNRLDTSPDAVLCIKHVEYVYDACFKGEGVDFVYLYRGEV